MANTQNSSLFISSPPDPAKTAEPLDIEFSINATIYGAQAWSDDHDTFFQSIWKSTLFASPSRACEAVYPLGFVKIVNLSYDTIHVTASEGLNSQLKITVPPQSETMLTSSSLSDVRASTTGKASSVHFLFHLFFSRDPVRPLHKD